MKIKEIITALESIKDYCKNNYDCYMCPYNDTICFDEETIPEFWELEKLKNKLVGGV